jgi:hypothetical protein
MPDELVQFVSRHIAGGATFAFGHAQGFRVTTTNIVGVALRQHAAGGRELALATTD